MRTAVLALALLALNARADEGMFTFDDFPADLVQKRYGFKPDAAWLEHLRLSSLRVAGGCSASFVSGSGLVLTNHHCVETCLHQHTTPRRDLLHGRFLAGRPGEELPCAGMEVEQLIAITDVTARMQAALAAAGGDDAEQGKARRAAIARIEKECTEATRPAPRCEVVTLYQGGKYHLYTYRPHTDLRLVFSPESQAAYFGGDPDNFSFPRFDLDMALLRAYDDEGHPLRPAHHLAWNAAGVKAGDLVFQSGHPGSTRRQDTVAELEFLRDQVLPLRLVLLAEERGRLGEYARRGAAQRRDSQEALWGVENTFKALAGEQRALLDGARWRRKVAEEAALRARIARDPKLARFAPAWDELERLQGEKRRLYLRHEFIEEGLGLRSELFGIARGLLRAAAERQKPDGERLLEYRDAALDALKNDLLAQTPIPAEVEELLLGFSLLKLREHLGADDPLVGRVLGGEAPEELARRVVRGTHLYDAGLRRRLWEGGEAAVAAARDPMLDLARSIDGEARALRREYEDRIEAVEDKDGERIGLARYLAGASAYPDATFSLRLSFGTVRGYEQAGVPAHVAPLTTIAGAFSRATGKEPFDLPPSWLAARRDLDPGTPLDFACDTDSVGGNSGSPLVDRQGRVVGLLFDGNLQSLGGTFWFDAADNRAVAVHSAGLLHVLRRVYHADALVRELLGE